eukprot:1308007-Pleurochrysis_carterae.AAC.2
MGMRSIASSRAAPPPLRLLPSRGAPSATTGMAVAFPVVCAGAAPPGRLSRAAHGRPPSGRPTPRSAPSSPSCSAAATPTPRARSRLRPGPGACAPSSGARASSASARCANPTPRAETAGTVPERVAPWWAPRPPASASGRRPAHATPRRPCPLHSTDARPARCSRWGGANPPTPKRPPGAPPPQHRPERSLRRPCARVLRAPLERRCPRRGRPRSRHGGVPVGRRRRRPRRAKRCCPSRPVPAAWGRWSRGRKAGFASATHPPIQTVT